MGKWLEIGFEIPFVGPFVKLAVVVIPPVLGVFILAGVLGGLSWGASVLGISLISILWLRFLEKRTGLKIVFPPINLPWIWICWAGVIYGILILLGIAK